MILCFVIVFVLMAWQDVIAAECRDNCSHCQLLGQYSTWSRDKTHDKSRTTNMAEVGAQCISRGGLGFLQFPGPQIYTITPAVISLCSRCIFLLSRLDNTALCSAFLGLQSNIN